MGDDTLGQQDWTMIERLLADLQQSMSALEALMLDAHHEVTLAAAAANRKSSEFRSRTIGTA